VAYAKDNPGKLNYGSPAPTVRLPLEALAGAAGVRLVHVPYVGGGPYMQALVANEVQVGLIPESVAKTFGERFRPLAVTGQRRLAAFPDVPTFNELGFPQIKGLAYSINMPAGVPKPVVDRLYAAASAALRDPDTRAAIAKMGFEVLEQSPEVAAKALADEAAFLSDVAAKIGLKPQ